MKDIKQTFLNHKWAIIFAVLVSIIVAFPQVYFRIEHRNDGLYQGIELLPDSPWSARVREVQDGHNLGSIYYKDGKDDAYLFQPLGSMTVAYMGKIFSFDINNTILFSRTILPFLAVLLLYSFVYFFSKDKFLAISSAAVVLLADTVLSPFGLRQILHGISPSSFLELSRPVNSAMIYIPFFAFLVSFWQFYRKRILSYGILSAVFLGLNFYNYFYTWTYLYAFGCFLVLIFLFKKRWQDAKEVMYVFIGALIIAIPYGFNLYRASQHPLYEEVGLRHGVIFSHAPIFVGFTVLLALFVFLFWFPKEDKEKYYFGLALLLAPFLTLNQQLLTGKILQEGHYHWYFHRPIAVIFILLTIFYQLTRREKNFCKKTLAIFIIIVCLATGIFIQTWSYYKDYPSRDGGVIAIERQKYGPVMKWLSENAKKEAVVYANDEISHLTVIYTPLNVFHHRSAQLLLSAPEERLRNVYFTFYRLRGIGEKDAEEIFIKERNLISSNIYGVYFRDPVKSYAGIPNEKLNELITLYKNSLSTQTSIWLREMWKKYEVEYLVWDKIKDPLWRLDRFSYLNKVAEFNNIIIYRFNP